MKAPDSSGIQHGDGPDEMSRRRFLSLMAASAALAGLASCRWPEEHAAPFAHRPAGMQPGEPRYFATSMDLGGCARPLLVTSTDGRPVKIEGNPGHPASLGASDVHAQASLLELYDPDRSRHPLHRGAPATWEEFSAALATGLREGSGGLGRGIAVIAERSSSPTTARLRQLFARRYPRSRWIEWEPATRASEREGLRLAYGAPVRPLYDIGRVKVLVSLESDLFSGHPDTTRHLKAWADARDPSSGEPPRMHAIESACSLTGFMADSRFPLRREQVERAATLLLVAVARLAGAALPAQVPPIAPPGHEFDFIQTLAADLVKAGPRGLIVAGPALPPAVHVVAAAINGILGSAGSLFELVPEAPEPAPLADLGTGGPPACVLVLGGNPAYDAPAELGIPAMLEAAAFSVHLSLYEDETSAHCKWHVPRAHYLESWGDGAAWDGAVCAVQPLVAPLYDGWTVDEFLARAAGHGKAKGHDLVLETWNASGSWSEFLRQGFSPAAADRPAAPPVDAGALTGALAALAAAPPPPAGIDVLFQVDAKVHDGRFGNNPWLQELPDPLTKLTWSNAALLDPATAEKEGLGNGDFVHITLGGRSVTLPAYVMPGQAPGTVVLPMGYGRTMKGRAANGAGWDVYPLRTSAALWHGAGAELRRATDRFEFAATADHYLIDSIGMKERELRGHSLVREATYAAHAADPAATARPRRHTPKVELWKTAEHGGHRWAVTIDLNRCNGCAACVLACQAENNVPIVGADEVRRGREMHWLRIDRVYKGGIANPVVRHQPVTCLHCETAPCEQVCPVAATVHSREGLNEMVYNRCIGTRYCSNNCPVKVRRFNYFNYHGNLDGIEKMRMNPEVSVRERGVMEKCSLCVQRIAAARIKAKVEGRELEVSQTLPACAQACPARAIRFGDLADGGSDFAARWKGPRSYEILEELNLGARVRYLARLNNPHPELVKVPEAHEQHHS